MGEPGAAKAAREAVGLPETPRAAGRPGAQGAAAAPGAPGAETSRAAGETPGSPGGEAPIRVLQVVPAMNAGGMETFIMNLYRAIDRTKVQFDFLYHYDMPCFYDEEIAALGGRVYKLSIRQDNDLPRYLRALRQFFAAHPEYRVLHGHYSGFGMFYNPAARRAGITVRAGHSHNTDYEQGLVGFLDRCMSFFFVYGLTDRFACGQTAGRALFRGRPFTFVPNGVNAAAFAPDMAARAAVREELGIPADALVLGHVGRFTAQKNHAFLLEIFAALAARRPDARLLLLGEGPLLDQTRARAAALGIADRVIFAGVRRDTAACYSAMDAFLLPSLFEGLPVVLVEAQAAGLPCFVSETVDATAAFCDGVRFLPIDRAEDWADAVLAAPPRRNPDALAQTRAAGYDMLTSARRMQEFYLSAHAGAPARG